MDKYCNEILLRAEKRKMITHVSYVIFLSRYWSDRTSRRYDSLWNTILWLRVIEDLYHPLGSSGVDPMDAEFIRATALQRNHAYFAGGESPEANIIDLMTRQMHI